MATNTTYQPYIQLSFKILENLQEFKTIQKEKENSLQDLINYKDLLYQNESLLNNFPQAKKDAFSQLSYLNINNVAQASFVNSCRELEHLLNTIETCKKHISFLDVNCKQEQLSKINNAERVINSVLLQLQLNQTKSGLSDITSQKSILENAISEYKAKQERSRLEKEAEEKRKRDEAERIRQQKLDEERRAKEEAEKIRQENEKREKRRREEEEQARLAAEQKKAAQLKLWLNIAKWSGIAIAAILLIIYVIIPIVTFIIANIVWILIGAAVIGFIIYKLNG